MATDTLLCCQLLMLQRPTKESTNDVIIFKDINERERERERGGK